MKTTIETKLDINCTLSSLLQQNIDFSLIIGIVNAPNIKSHATSIALKRNNFFWIQKQSKTIMYPAFDNDTEKGAL